jgi:hypothetical protein
MSHIAVFAESFAVVGGNDNQRLVIQAALAEPSDQPFQLGIEKGDRSVVLGNIMAALDFADGALAQCDIVPDRVR